MLEVNPRTGEVFINGERQRIQKRGTRLLIRLLESSDKFCTFDELKDTMWMRDEFACKDHGLKVGMYKLRQVIGPAAIETLKGYGYRLHVDKVKVRT